VSNIECMTNKQLITYAIETHKAVDPTERELIIELALRLESVLNDKPCTKN